MRFVKNIAAAAVISLAIVQPAMAQSGMMTEPSDLSLLALGVIGVVLGQRGARKLGK